jgi:hypothetical protein
MIFVIDAYYGKLYALEQVLFDSVHKNFINNLSLTLLCGAIFAYFYDS